MDAHVHIRDAAAFAVLRDADIAAVRDAGLRERNDRGLLLPRTSESGLFVVSSGWAVYRRGGYGGRFGVAVDSTDEIRREIRRLRDAGAGIIKVIASGMVSFKNPGTITAGGFSRDALSFIVQEAAELGLGVMAHANGEEALVASAEARVVSVEHGFFMTRRALEVMAELGTFWVPTVGALARAAEAATDDVKTYITGLIGAHLETIRQAHDLGVPLAVGTDAVLPDADYRAQYAAELRYFERAGLSPDEVMSIARDGGARLVGI